MGSSRVIALAGVAALLVPALATAADRGWYAGASLGEATFDGDDFAPTDSVRPNSIDDTGFKLIAGYRALDWLAIEANYVDFGSPGGALDLVCVPEIPECLGHFELDARAYSLSAIAGTSAGPFDFFVRAGVARWDAEVSQDIFPGVRFEESGTDAVYGLGVQLNLEPVAVRLELERHELDEAVAELLSLGVTWSFN